MHSYEWYGTQQLVGPERRSTAVQDAGQLGNGDNGNMDLEKSKD